MQFVVPIPLWLYAIFVLVVISLGAYVFAIVLCLGFVYFLITQPRQTLSVIASLALLALVAKYWKIALPLAILFMIFSCIKFLAEPEGNGQEALEEKEQEDSPYQRYD